MKIKTHNKRGIMWVLVIFSLVFLTANTQAEEKSKPRFSIKLTGGLGCFNWGDINTYLESFDDCLSKRTHYKGGETRKLNYGLDFEEELRIDLNSKFGIGLSIGIISGECKIKLINVIIPLSIRICKKLLCRCGLIFFASSGIFSL